MKMSLQRAALAAAAFLAVTIAALPAHAQLPIKIDDSVETVDFDRPESWALKYFNATTLFTGLEVPGPINTWGVRVGVEVASIPSLTAEQQRVGFSGTKQEDLNKAPMFARPRVTIGLPDNFSLTIAGVPPITAFGITPKLLALSLGRPIVTGDAWNLGARASAQVGHARGAFTCSADVVAFPLGSPGNPHACTAVSDDTAHLRYVAGEVDLWRTFGSRGLTPHFNFTVAHMNNRFNVDARTRGALFDFVDRSELNASGTNIAVGGGVGFPLANRLNASIDLSYAPLGVMRDLGRNLSTAVSNEGLFNIKALVTYQVK